MKLHRLTLLIGGVRAGKSRRALDLATARSGDRRVLLVATAEALDDEMRARIEAHRRERPGNWDTLEAPIEVVGDLKRRLAAVPDQYSVVVLDCITLWVSNLLLALPDHTNAEHIIAERTRELVDLLGQITSSGEGVSAIIVTNEVGLGVVPAAPLGRRYRDALGRANQIVASAADEVMVMIAGLELQLKPRR